MLTAHIELIEAILQKWAHVSISLLEIGGTRELVTLQFNLKDQLVLQNVSLAKPVATWVHIDVKGIQ